MRLFAVTPIVLALSAGSIANAAIAPKSPEKLKELSTHIIEGTVTEISSESIEVSGDLDEIRKKIGAKKNTNRIYTIKIRVEKIDKGEGIKTEEEVSITAWKPDTRPLPEPGPQGHENIPETGDRVTVYLKKSGDKLEPIMPNGIVGRE